MHTSSRRARRPTTAFSTGHCFFRTIDWSIVRTKCCRVAQSRTTSVRGAHGSVIDAPEASALRFAGASFYNAFKR
jgi:hypothetical protein